jgi:hypothetical protein
MSDKKELAVVSSRFAVPQFNDEIAQGMAEEMDGLAISFDRAKIPSGGGLAFEVPGEDPESPDMVKEIVGVIVDHYPINAYWTNKFSGQNNPPDCASMGGKSGEGNPGGSCAKCPFNQYGSADDGRGKACKNMHRIYILRSGEIFPILLTLPPTSIKSFSDYIAKRVLAKSRRSYGVITKITLKKAQNSTGINYSQAQFAVEAVLDPETTAKIQEFSQQIKATTRQVAIADEASIVNDEGLPF